MSGSGSRGTWATAGPPRSRLPTGYRPMAAAILAGTRCSFSRRMGRCCSFTRWVQVQGRGGGSRAPPPTRDAPGPTRSDCPTGCSVPFERSRWSSVPVCCSPGRAPSTRGGSCTWSDSGQRRRPKTNGDGPWRRLTPGNRWDRSTRRTSLVPSNRPFWCTRRPSCRYCVGVDNMSSHRRGRRMVESAGARCRSPTSRIPVLASMRCDWPTAGSSLVYNPTVRGRNRLVVAVSGDGRIWRAGLELESESDGEYSYPAIVQSEDGRVHVTYTWRRQRVRHVVFDPSQIR